MTDHIKRLKDALDPPGRFKPTRGNWVADAHENWAQPMTEVRTEKAREEGGHSIVRIHADFSCTVGKSEYEWANAAFVAAANPDAIRELLSERDALLSSLEELSRKHQFHLERSAQRSLRLWQWAHEELTEPLKTRYFNIVANGTADVMESPTYAQQYNLLRHRLDECADVLSWLYASLPMNEQDTQRVGRILGRARAAQSIFPATFTPPPTSPAFDAPERDHG